MHWEGSHVLSFISLSSQMGVFLRHSVYLMLMLQNVYFMQWWDMLEIHLRCKY